MRLKAIPALASPIALLLVLLFLATNGAGQERAPAPAGADTTEAVPAVISASEVPRRAEEARSHLRSIRSECNRSHETETIEKALPDVANIISDLETNPILRAEGVVSPRALDDVVNSSQAIDTRLQTWSAGLEKRAGTLLGYQADLTSIRETWERTRAQLREDGAAPGLIQEPDSVLVRVARAERQLTDRLSEVQTLQGDVAKQTSRLQVVLDRIDAVSDRSNLLAPEQPPLWEELGSVADSTGGAAALRQGWRHFFDPLPGFYRRSAQRVLIQALCFVFLVVGILLSRRRIQESQEEPLPTEARTILERPVSAALLATLLFTRPIYPYAPSGVYVINLALGIVPLLRLLPRMVPATLRKTIWGTAAIFLLDNLTAFLLESSGLHRFYLLVVTLLALVGGVVLLRSGTLSRTFPGRAGSVSRGLVRFGVVALGVAILANLVGAVSLAMLLADAIIWGYFLVLIAVALVGVFDGLFEVLFRSRPLGLLQSVRRNRALLIHRARRIVRIGITAAWVITIFRILRIMGAVTEGLDAVLGAGFDLGAIRIDFGTIVLFLVILWFSTLLSRFIRFVLGEDVLPRLQLPLGVPQTITQLTHYALITIGFLVAVASTGFDLTRLTILAGALGVGVGFGLQTVVNNFVSGLILMMERPVRIGDTVEIGTLLGKVKSIGIRASVVQTFSGADVIVPNGDLLAGNLVNWTLSNPRRRIEIPVGVAYGSDVERVQAVLLEVARGHPECLEWPEPVALFLGFGDSSLDFELRAWTGEEWVRVRSEVVVAINRALVEEKITIPFPQRDVHLRTDATPGGSGEETGEN